MKSLKELNEELNALVSLKSMCFTLASQCGIEQQLFNEMQQKFITKIREKIEEVNREIS